LAGESSVFPTHASQQMGITCPRKPRVAFAQAVIDVAGF
jgi:hypothetical protein